MHFLRPWWFLALLPLAPLIIQLWRRGGQAGVWRGLVDAHLLPHLLVGEDGGTRRLPLALLAAAWLTAVTALAGPVWERLPQPVFGTATKRVILLDLSASMNAADVAPSRLARARFEVLDLLAATREGQVALIAFGSDPFIVSPLTGDAQTIAAQVPRLTTDLIPVPGPRRTERALALAGELLNQAGGGAGEVILLTDGVTDGPTSGGGLGTLVNAAARSLAAAGHRLSVLGVGTTQGAPVPGPNGGFVDAGSGIGLSRLDPGALETLARAGNGRYVELAAGDQDTQALLAGAAPLTPREVLDQPGLAADQWREEGPWLLLGLLPIAALAFRRGWWLPVIALVLVLPPGPGWAFGWDDLWQRPDQQAARHLAAGEDATAAQRFADPAWRAAARYRSGDYAGALADLTGLTGPDADYNRGNALARSGRLDESIEAYEQAIAQVPDHADARANLEQVKRLRDQQATTAPPPQGTAKAGDEPSKEDGKNGTDGEDQEDGKEAGAKSGASVAPDPQETGQQTSATSGAAGPSGKQSDPKGATPPTASAKPPADESDADPQGTPGDPGGHSGASTQPTAGDLRPQTQDGETPVSLPGTSGTDADQGPPPAAKAGGQAAQGDPHPPETADLRQAGAADLSPQAREQLQALEAQLRRVPDDPAGLLRQRFLLQQLRREGRLP